MNDKLAEALKRFWAETSPALCDHGADVANALEAKYDIRLPEDFKAYLVEGSPAEEAMRGRGFSLWAPERIKSMPDECHSETPLDQINPVIRSKPIDTSFSRIFWSGAMPTPFAARKVPTEARLQL